MAQAACTGVVAGPGGSVRFVAAVPEGAVSITVLGHASFLIESPEGVRIVTDYKVAAIPVSAFYEKDAVTSVVRFCFAKQDATLDTALERLSDAVHRR